MSFSQSGIEESLAAAHKELARYKSLAEKLVEALEFDYRLLMSCNSNDYKESWATVTLNREALALAREVLGEKGK